MSVKTKDKNEIKTGWEMVVQEAKRQIAEAQNHIRQLRESIRISEEKLKSGEPWPGDSQTGKVG